MVVAELGSDDAGRVEPETVPVEGERSFEIVDRERDHVDAGFHHVPPLWGVVSCSQHVHARLVMS